MKAYSSICFLDLFILRVRLLFLSVFLVLIQGCDPTDGLKQGGGKTLNDNIEAVTSQEDEVLINEPVSVAGAFLVCAPAPKISEEKREYYLGCRLEQKDKGKVTLDATANMIRLSENNNPVPLEVRPKDDFWHWAAPMVGELGDYAVRVLNIPGVESGLEGKILDQHPELEPLVKINLQPLTNQILFTSSSVMTPGLDFTGAAGANIACQNLANAAGINRAFKAILSEVGVNAIDAVPVQGNVVNTAGQLISTEAGFWSTGHQIGKNMNENGNMNATATVWTGTGPDGQSLLNATCSSWQLNAELASSIGDADAIDDFWVTAFQLVDCAEAHRIYCISDYVEDE